LKQNGVPYVICYFRCNQKKIFARTWLFLALLKKNLRWHEFFHSNFLYAHSYTYNYRVLFLYNAASRILALQQQESSCVCEQLLEAIICL